MAAELAYPGTDKYSMAEFMAIILARQAGGDGECTGGGGANQAVALAANRLAQITVRPDLWLFTGGAGVYNGKFDTLPIGTWDPRCGHGAECKIYIADVVDGGTRGGRSGQGTGRMKAAGSGGFGGIQVDKHGNINMIGIGPHPRLKVRGPGTVGTIWMGSAPSNVYVEHHSKRVFVEKCDYISGPGWLSGGDSRHKLLNGRDGPEYIWTPICVFDFTEDEHRARIASVHPGYTVEDVIANTGFEPAVEGKVPTTTPPTDWELDALRTKVDRNGVLKMRRMTVGV
jgi:glutaconate CoA-transferase, subunit B